MKLLLIVSLLFAGVNALGAGVTANIECQALINGNSHKMILDQQPLTNTYSVEVNGRTFAAIFMNAARNTLSVDFQFWKAPSAQIVRAKGFIPHMPQKSTDIEIQDGKDRLQIYCAIFP